MNQGYAIALNEWIFDTRIKSELPLLLYISSLTAAEGYAYPSNGHLADKFNTTDVTISRKLAKLEKLGYINMHYIKRGSQVVARHIRLTKMLTDGYQKCYPTVNKNVKEKSTRDNNTRSNKDILSSKPDIAEKIINYLNDKTGRKYRAVPSQKKFIEARIAEGATEQDLIAVIDRKCLEWLDDPKFAQYLRPSTLFNAEKFNTYIGQIDSPLPTKQSNHSQANRHTGFDKKDYTNGLIEQEDGTYAF